MVHIMWDVLGKLYGFYLVDKRNQNAHSEKKKKKKEIVVAERE